MCSADGAVPLIRKVVNSRSYSLAICNNCGQHFCTPQPSAAEIRALYSGDYHSNLRSDGGTERVFAAKFAQYRDWILRFLPQGRVLDVGTATGLLPRILKDAGFDAEGIEYNSESARWGERHYNVRIMTTPLENSNLEPHSYDLIVMTDVLEHTEHPLRFLTLARDYLKPHGFMLISFPDITSFESRYTWFTAHALRRNWIWERCVRVPYHVWEFTPATARAMFDKANFEVLGFWRRQFQEVTAEGKLGLMLWPLRLLSVGWIGRIAGTQMHFMLRLRDV